MAHYMGGNSTIPLTIEYVRAYLLKEDYILLSEEYKNSREKLFIQCPKGHEFLMNFNAFKSRGHRCPVCKLERNTRSYEDIKCIIDTSGYEILEPPSNKRYIRRDVISYKCCEGHLNNIKVGSLVRGGAKCKQCVLHSRKLGIDDVKEKFVSAGLRVIGGHFSDRSKHELIAYECEFGHREVVSYDQFVRLPSCKECRRRKRIKPFSDIEEYFSRNGYTLLCSEEDYINNTSKLKSKCPAGHIYMATWDNFFSKGARCPICNINAGVSKAETEIADYVESLNIEIVRNSRSIISPYEVDIYIPSKKLAIEYDGLYWHSELGGGKNRYYHREKYDLCLDHGIRLITLFEDEFLKYKEVVLSRIRSALGFIENRIYARNCDVDFVSSSAARNFLSQYHLQGAGKARYYIGLSYNGDLVSVMSFGLPSRPHLRKSGLIELKRMCSKPDIQAVGGFSKMFKFILPTLKEAGFSKVVSYCDLRWSSPTPVYEKMGFVLQNETKYTPHYIDTDYLSRLRNQMLAIKPEERALGKSEWELRKEQGYDRIWDCGHRSYIYNL